MKNNQPKVFNPQAHARRTYDRMTAVLIAVAVVAFLTLGWAQVSSAYPEVQEPSITTGLCPEGQSCDDVEWELVQEWILTDEGWVTTQPAPTQLPATGK